MNLHLKPTQFYKIPIRMIFPLSPVIDFAPLILYALNVVARFALLV